MVPRAPRLGADTPQDALAICLDTRGRVDLGEIAHLLGTDPGEAREQLGELVYEDPAEQRLVPAAEYLSGNVRAKLEHARHAAIERPELEVNVRALERVLPADLTVEEIEPRLGAVWIDADTHRQFLAEILEDPDIQVEHPGGAMWAVKGRSWSVQATSVWGTERMPAPALAKAVLEQRPIQVTDETDDGRRVVNPTETAAAQEKAQALAGALRRVVLGGPRPRPPARRRVQPPVQRNRAARLQHRGRAAHPPRPRAHLHAAAASARRGRADARRARRRALPPGRRRQDRRDGDRRDGAPPPRPRLKTRRGGPQPHARAVLPRVAAALPPSPSPGRLKRRSRRRAAPRVRRPHRGQRLGRGDPHPLRVRAPPRLRRRRRSPTPAASSRNCARCSSTPRAPAG